MSGYFRRSRGYADTPSDSTSSTSTAEYRETSGSCGMFIEFFLTPWGRKVQNFVYFAGYAAMLFTSAFFVDINASFQMYYSPTYDPSKAFNLQIEWLTVIFAATGVISSLWKMMDINKLYEGAVKRGFCGINWVFLAIGGGSILVQLFVMECNGVLGYNICFAFLWFSVVIALGMQEHQGTIYKFIQDATERAAPYTGSAGVIRSQRMAYWALSWIPLTGVFGLLLAQAAYDGIKGTTDPPDFLKAYLAVTIFWVILINSNSAWNIVRTGEAKSDGEAIRAHAVQESVFMALLFLWTVIAMAFVYPGMRNNNNLNYCASTPIQTIN